MGSLLEFWGTEYDLQEFWSPQAREKAALSRRLKAGDRISFNHPDLRGSDAFTPRLHATVLSVHPTRGVHVKADAEETSRWVPHEHPSMQGVKYVHRVLHGKALQKPAGSFRLQRR